MQIAAAALRRTSAAPVRAALLLLLGGVLISVQNVLIRRVGADLPTFEIVFFRALFGLVAMLPFFWGAGFWGAGLSLLSTRRLGAIMASSVLHMGAMVAFFAALVMLPLAEVTALGFTKPLFATLGAALILREVVRLRRWSAVIAGFIGVLVILQPGVEPAKPAMALVLGAAVFSAGVALIVKRLADHESSVTIVFYQSLFTTLLGLVPALLVWSPPSASEWLALAVIGALGTINWLCFTRAFALVDISLAMPFDFAKLPFAALAAYVAFGEVPTWKTWVGGAIIFAAAAYIAHREARVTGAGTAAPQAGEAIVIARRK